MQIKRVYIVRPVILHDNCYNIDNILPHLPMLCKHSTITDLYIEFHITSI